MRLRRLLVVAVVIGLGAVLTAQAPPRPTPVSTENSAGKGPLDRLAFRAIGPATPSGRIDDFAVLEVDPTTFYVATATSGIYKTTNGGTTFTPVFDNEGTASVGDVAIAPTDANLVWVGTGEDNNRQSSSWGDGIYKSTDGGRIVEEHGPRDSKQIARIIVDPMDFNVVYVAALGDLWAAGGERGVYKTTDGGTTWKRTLHVDDDTGATELVMDPSNNKTLYAATYQRRRAQWGMNGGGPGSAHLEVDRRRRRPGRSSRTAFRPGRRAASASTSTAATPTSSTRASSTRPRAASIARDDGGASWRKLSNVNPRPMYFSQIRVDPQTDSRIYVLGVAAPRLRRRRQDLPRRWRRAHPRRSPRDAGSTRRIRSHLMIGNDGGVSISHDRVGDVGVAAQPARRAGLSRRVRHADRRITSAPACRTTTPGAARARCAPTAASTTTTGT